MKPLLFYFLTIFALLPQDIILAQKVEETKKLSDVIVTSVEYKEENGEKYAVVEINDGMKISDIKITEKVVKGEKKTEIKFPVYVSRAGREYPQVKITSKDVYSKIRSAVISGEVEKVKGEIPDIRYAIGRIFPLRSKTRKANAEVIINDSIVVTVGIMVSKQAEDEYWIAWPSKRVGGEFGTRYLKHIRFKDEKLRKKIEEAVITKYKKFLKEYTEDEY